MSFLIFQILKSNYCAKAKLNKLKICTKCVHFDHEKNCHVVTISNNLASIKMIKSYPVGNYLIIQEKIVLLMLLTSLTSDDICF